eukprot:scaffold15591_cov63-Skeletonema_menzelii.AAC.1
MAGSEIFVGQASFWELSSALKEKYRVLTSIDGFHENVIVVKPPMVFTKEDAVEFVTSFEKCLIDLPAIDKLNQLEKTPT